MASLPLVVQLFVNGAWTTYAGYSEEGWTSRVGPDADAGLQPNQIGFTFANDDLNMDPTNPASPLYGQIGRNTPCRIVIGGITITWAEIASWRPDRTPGHTPGVRGRSWTAVTGEGLLRRLGRWTDPVDSALRRQIGLYATLLGYWPLEDPSGAARLAQVVSGGDPGLYSGSVTLAGDPGAGGSDAVLTIATGGQVGGIFRSPSGNGYQISFAMKLKQLPASATYGTIFAFTDSAGRTYSWQVNNTTYRTVVQDADGTALDTSVIAVQPILAWTRMRVKVTVAAGTVTYEPAWYVQDDSSPTGITATFAGATTGRPRTWTIPGNAYTDGGAYGHVFALTDTTLDIVGVGGDARAVFNGYLGERAAYRWARLLTEAGLTCYVSNAAWTVPMGRQKSGTLLDLIDECARSEAGLIYDEPQDIALTMRGYRDLINLTPALALVYSSNVAPPLLKDITDTWVVNDLTVTNYDGYELHVDATTGRLSTAPPPAGAGRYKKTLAVNVADSDRALFQRARLELAQGTVDRPRYRQVNVDLLANPSLRSAVCTLRPGDHITLTGVEPDMVTLRFMSAEHSGGAVAHTATLNCLPADTWITGIYDATARRQDSASTKLAAAATSSATALLLTTVNQFDVWSTTAPYDLLVAGERVRVTAMTAAAGTAGVGPFTQTATVTRSINGIVKAQLINAEVRVFDPARYAYGGF